MDYVIQQGRRQTFWEKRQQESCPLCEGTGFRLIEKEGQTRARKCRCISKERIKALRTKSGIPAIYWNESLEETQPQSLEEIALLDILKDFLNERESPATHLWIVPVENLDVQRLLCRFANDLIRFLGYFCLWLDCSILGRSPTKLSTEKMTLNPEFASEADYLFIESYQPGLLRNKPQKCLEEILWRRIRCEKPTFLLGITPSGLKGSIELFLDRKLGMEIFKRFRMIEPGKTEDRFQNSRWLF